MVNREDAPFVVPKLKHISQDGAVSGTDSRYLLNTFLSNKILFVYIWQYFTLMKHFKLM